MFNKRLFRCMSPRLQRALPILASGLFCFALVIISSEAIAQELPDAGRILQESLPTLLQPVKPSVDFAPEGPQLDPAVSGGAAALVKGVVFTGNTVFSQETLGKVVGDIAGKSYDLGGLRQLANRVSRYYRDEGYPFARAYIPEQNLIDGTLTIAVIEGRYGTVKAEGNGNLAAGAQGFLKTLEPGSVIQSKSLERATLILGDQPGVQLAPVIRPGTEQGSGDLAVRVIEKPRINGQVTADNHGNRYSGEYRTQVELRLNRIIMFGDEIMLRGLYSSEDLWLGQIAYSMPLGRSGLRGWASYAHTGYDLQEPFEGYTGTARIITAGLNYPLIRSRGTNLFTSIGYQHKNLDDELLATRYNESSSNSWPVGLQFDHRDDLAEGGVIFGDLTLTPGNLNSNSNGTPDGGFTKVNLQLARIQNLPAAFSLFARVSGQWADRELDSSECFTLGGAGGVRAYPQGEGSGTNGWLGTLELRYTIKNFVPYLFYDSGEIFKDAEDHRRRIAGAGIGLRCSYGNWGLDLISAWKTDGGDARSDDHQRNPRFWFSGSYRF